MLALSEAVARFIGSLEARGVPMNTVRSYRSDLVQFQRIAPEELDAVDVRTVESFLDRTGGLSAATARRRYASLSSLFGWLVQQELAPLNPLQRVQPSPRPHRQPRPLAPDRVEAVLKAIPSQATRDRALFTLLYESGMRVGEALGMQVSEVDLSADDEKVRVTGKGDRERTVLLTAAPRSIVLLRKHLKANQLSGGRVFRGDERYGGSSLSMNYTTVRRAWVKYCRKAGVQATIHQLRHSRASELVCAGVPLGTVRKLLGHRSIQSTMLYAEVDEQTVKLDLLQYRRRQRKR